MDDGHIWTGAWSHDAYDEMVSSCEELADPRAAEQAQE